MTNINPSPILNDSPTRRASISQQREIPSEAEKPEGKKTVNKALMQDLQQLHLLEYPC